MIGISSNHQLHIFRVALVTVLVTIALLLVLFSVYLSRVQLEHEKNIGQINEFLSEWWMNHILIEDMKHKSV